MMVKYFFHIVLFSFLFTKKVKKVKEKCFVRTVSLLKFTLFTGSSLV